MQCGPQGAGRPRTFKIEQGVSSMRSLPMPKLHNRQSLVTNGKLRERLGIAMAYVELTRVMCDLGFGGEIHMETLLTALCVFIGEAEGRPTTATKIAQHSGLPRATIYRRLGELMKLKKVVRVGRNYCLAENAITPDRNNRLSRILDNLCG
jgi:hypothetical protein